jgi:hypothetical protein
MTESHPPSGAATASGSGFEGTRVRQFTIFLANKVGRLQQLVRTLEASNSRIAALAIEESADTALVRCVVTDPDSSRETLRDANVMFTETDLLAVELPANNPQPLISICSALLAAEINIHYAYPLLFSPRGPSLVVYVDDPTLAARLLIRKGFTLIGLSDLANQ